MLRIYRDYRWSCRACRSKPTVWGFIQSATPRPLERTIHKRGLHLFRPIGRGLAFCRVCGLTKNAQVATTDAL